MNKNSSNSAIKWAAQLAHVREVSVLGAADLDYWSDWLRKEELTPAQRDGQAQFLIVAADSNYMGVRFRELSFSVLVSKWRDTTWQDAAYLVQAFNSCWFIAFCERRLFYTPYRHFDVRVQTSLPASIQLVLHGESVFELAMRAEPHGAVRQPLHCGENGWEGPVFLPARPGTKNQSHLFFARIRGDTGEFPFIVEDKVTISAANDNEIFRALRESHFVASEWHIRGDATHAKSKTYRRTDWLSGIPQSGADPPTTTVTSTPSPQRVV